jgi:phospholipid/cholesterol/gamma-HCH transport system substrate-binding protein
MTDAGKLARVLDEQNALLSSTLDSLTPVARALADDHGRTLNGVVTSADRLLATTSANQQALQQVLADLPQTLSTARATLAALAHAAASTAPTLQAIRPISDNLSQITDELHQFASSANPALASAEPVLKKAQTLLTNAQPVVAQLQAAGPAGLQDARSAQPLVSHLSANIDNVLNFLKYWALSTNGYDGLSHYFRGVVVATPAIATGSLPLTGGGSTKPTTPTKAAPNPLPITKTVTGLLGGLLAPTTGKDDGVTGLTKAQEKGGLLSLLGLGGP